MSKLQGIERALPESLRSQVDFIMVTFTPGEDTKERLSEFRRENRLSEHFTLLRGSEEATSQLARTLGFGIQRGSAQRSHSTLLTLTDSHGKILAQDGDLHAAARPLAQAIQTYLRDGSTRADNSR